VSRCRYWKKVPLSDQNRTHAIIIGQGRLELMKHTVGIIDSDHDSYIRDAGIEMSVLADIADVEVIKVPSAAHLKGRVENLEAAISWHLVPLPDNVLAHFHKCKHIVRAAVGFDNIDVEYASANGIRVYTVPDYGTEEVADHAMSLILALIRKLSQSNMATSKGCWDWRALGDIPRIRGLRVGIIGFGRIGTAVAKRAQVFGMDVGFFDPYVADGTDKSHGVSRYENLHDLLKMVDVVSIHTPLNSTTLHMIGKREMALMKNDVVLVNTARGGIVVEQDLVEAVKNNAIGYVGCDVLENEPAIPEALSNSDKVILTPHSAFYSNQSLLELRHKAAMSIRKLLQGEVDAVRTCVNN